MIDTKNNEQNILNFRISSQLKSVIGRDLITDDYVAIFELVKNAFDAKAEKVDLYFAKNQIHIIDDGKGLSYDDLVNKWLFVAYSAKKDGSEDSGENERLDDYRNEIQATRHYAGSKGVGRFSCDRLGSDLLMQSRTLENLNEINSLRIDWSDFEADLTDEFIKIPVIHETSNAFNVPDWLLEPKVSGTVISITGCREEWSRRKLLELKTSLAKLINPFGNDKKDFSIFFHAPEEAQEDDAVSLRHGGEVIPNSTVNGKVENFIFQALQEKTTWIKTWVDKKSNKLFTELNDRGTLIYRISESLDFKLLADTEYECNLFYLNRSAKSTFSRRMGISSIGFGSVFLFKNGFRVYPIGEATDDSFGIDRRKQQGYARFLGTRDVVGRIDVFGDDTKFKESSSRDKGLIETPAATELSDCFWQKCFLRLENYVVGVSWTLRYDMDLEDSSFLLGDEAKAKVIAVLARLTSSPEITVEAYAKDILTIISNKVDGYGKTIDSLAALANKVGDTVLEVSAREAGVKYLEMQKAEADAIAYAGRERNARKEAEKKEQLASSALEKEQQRNLFLTSLQSHDKDILENLHHQVIIYASNAINNIEASLITLKNGTKISTEDFQETLENLLLLNQQVIAASRFATTANFRMESNSIEEDLGNYIQQYLERVCPIHESRISVTVEHEGSGFKTRFKPIEVSIILDNLIDNAYKAGASIIKFSLTKPESNLLQITARDDGLGLDSSIIQTDSIFSKGVTTTQGSGLGLYHVRQLIEGMRGTIVLQSTNNMGTVFSLKVYK
jgi:signal transduction histidine kinase